MEIIDPNSNPNPIPPVPEKPVENKKMIAGLCAILVGTIGVHKFVLGYNQEGIIYIGAFVVIFIFSMITCGIGTFLFIPLGAIPFIEGIIYLTKSDEDFFETYQKNKRPWF
jgi:TM2 domain-containing membrane protein YozV